MRPNDMDAKCAVAMDIIWTAGRVSTSLVENHMRNGFIQASQIIDELERRGYVSKAQGLEPRKILRQRQAIMPTTAFDQFAQDDFTGEMA